MTTRDISSHLRDVYGVEASAEMISHMTDRILPIAKEWQNRPLERKYAIVFMDAVHFHVREDNRTVKSRICCDWCKIKRKTRSSWYVDWWK